MQLIVVGALGKVIRQQAANSEASRTVWMECGGFVARCIVRAKSKKTRMGWEKNITSCVLHVISHIHLMHHPRLYPDPLTNAVIHVEESANVHSGLGGLVSAP